MATSPAIATLSHGFAEQRPVLSKQEATALCKRVLSMTSHQVASVTVRHSAYVMNHLANGQILSGDDGDALQIMLRSKWGVVGPEIRVTVNQLDDTTLRSAVEQWEALRLHTMERESDPTPMGALVQDTPVPVALWHEDTVRAMTSTRESTLPEVLSAVRQSGFEAAGFLGLIARAEATLGQDNIFFYYEETDSELTITARNPATQASGWAGQAARNWSQVRPADVVGRAIDMAKRSEHPVAIEPGRRTAILGPDAVAQIIRQMAAQYSANETDDGRTGFSDRQRKNKLRQRVFDPHISLNSDPNDPEGGYCPFFLWMSLATPPMQWVDQGVLKNLAYDLGYAMARGKQYAMQPDSVRMSVHGPQLSIEEMIAQCKEGIYVNRFNGVEVVDKTTGLMSGATRDGCLLVKNGKIDRAVKNLRFLDSPFFFLNNVIAMGTPRRAAFGFTPPGMGREFVTWPLPPVIVPPLMVRDFNFSALVDAV